MEPSRKGLMSRAALALRTAALLTVVLLAACNQTSDAPAALESQATFITVTSGADSGDGTLRNAIAQANAGDSITFANDVRTVTLANELVIDKDLTILAGKAWGSVTVSGNDSTGIFRISAGTTVELGRLTITGGNADSGGGIYNDGTLTVTISTISDNSAGHGGGIYNDGTLTVISSTISGNSATVSGGIYNDGTLTVISSTISGNSATVSGGILNDGTLTVTNSTIANNNARFDGGGILNDGTLTVTYSTVSGNNGSNGGGINNNGTLDLSNSIVALNSAPNGPDLYGNVSSGSNNLIGGNPGLVLDSNGKPDLVYYRGPTKIIALLANSPALDDAAGANCPATDQRGVPRPQGSGCDIGAFELEAVDTTPPVIDAYTLDFTTAPTNRLLWNVSVGRGITGPSSPGKVWLYTQRKGYGDGNTAFVVGSNKALIIGKNNKTLQPYLKGGRMDFVFNKFAPAGVRVKTIKVSGVTTARGRIDVWRGNTKAKSVAIPVTGANGSAVLTFDEAGIGRIKVYLTGPGAVDDVAVEVVHP